MRAKLTAALLVLGITSLALAATKDAALLLQTIIVGVAAIGSVYCVLMLMPTYERDGHVLLTSADIVFTTTLSALLIPVASIGLAASLMWSLDATLEQATVAYRWATVALATVTVAVVQPKNPQ
jgi:hypothetical protein